LLLLWWEGGLVAGGRGIYGGFGKGNLHDGEVSDDLHGVQLAILGFPFVHRLLLSELVELVQPGRLALDNLGHRHGLPDSLSLSSQGNTRKLLLLK